MYFWKAINYAVSRGVDMKRKNWTYERIWWSAAKSAVMLSSDTNTTFYTPSQEDINASDWEIVT